MSTIAERPVRWILALGLLACLGVSSCGRGPSGDVPPGSDPTPEPAPPSSVPGDGAPGAASGSLETDVETGDGGVTVSWTWHNDTGEDVLVADRAAGAAGTLSASAAYVVGLAEGGVQVGQRVFDRPTDDPNSYAAPFYLGVTRVGPGRSVDGEVRVGSMTAEDKPFPGYYAAGEAPVPDDAATMTFCIGVLGADQPTEREDGRLVTTHGDASGQTLFCADPVELG